MKIHFRRCLFVLWLLMAMRLNAQINLLGNSGFEEYEYFDTELSHLPIYAATSWKGFNTPDLYLRKGLDAHQNIVRLAPYLNECIIGSLKYPTQKDTEYKFSLDVFSFKSRRYKNFLQICFFEDYDESATLPEFKNCLEIPAKKLKKGWQTLELEFYVAEGIKEILIGNTKALDESFILFLDNVTLIAPEEKAEGSMQIRE